MPKKDSAKRRTQPQRDDSFEAVAKRLGADEDKARFIQMLGQIAKAQPKRKAPGKAPKNVLTGTIEEITERARQIVSGICPEAWCQEQEWDARIDFGVKQPDGKVASEWIVLREITEARIKACAKRLKLRQQGVHVALVNEIAPPILLRRSD